MPKKTVASLFLAASILAAGCAGDELSDGAECVGAKCDSLGNEDASKHRLAVLDCEARETEALDKAETNADMVAAETEYEQCLDAANYGAIPEIEQILRSNDSREAGTVQDAFDDYGARKLCGSLVRASDGAQGTIAGLYRQDCEARWVRNLSDYIDAYVDFGGSFLSMSDEQLDSECMQAFEATPVDTQSSMNRAALALADCIGSKVLDLAPSVLRGIEENALDPYQPEELDQVVHDIEVAMIETLGVHEHTCALVASAGLNAGGSLAELDAYMCAARANNRLLQSVRGFVAWLEWLD